MNTHLESKFLGGFNPFLFPLNNLNYQKKKAGLILLTNALIKLHKDKENKRLEENLSNTSINDNIEIKLTNILDSIYLFPDKNADSLEMIVDDFLTFIDGLDNPKSLNYNLELILSTTEKYLIDNKKKNFDQLISQIQEVIDLALQRKSEAQLAAQRGDYDEDEMNGGVKTNLNISILKFINKILYTFSNYIYFYHSILKKKDTKFPDSAEFDVHIRDLDTIKKLFKISPDKMIQNLKTLNHNDIIVVYKQLMYEAEDGQYFDRILVELLSGKIDRNRDEKDFTYEEEIPPEIFKRDKFDDNLNLDSLFLLEKAANIVDKVIIDAKKKQLKDENLRFGKNQHLEKLGLNNSYIIIDLVSHLKNNKQSTHLNLDLDSETDLKDLINNKLNILIESYSKNINEISKIKSNTVSKLMNKLSKNNNNLALFIACYNILRRFIETSGKDNEFVNNIFKIMLLSLMNLNDGIN